MKAGLAKKAIKVENDRKYELQSQCVHIVDSTIAKT